jgi:hypothetical protein
MNFGKLEMDAVQDKLNPSGRVERTFQCVEY